MATIPAQLNIMKAVYEGTQVPFDAALRIETRYFLKTMMTPQAKGMIRTLFLSLQELGKGSGRPANVPPSEAKKVAVLGAGMMGAGIAYVQAMAGIESILIDQTQEAADKGKAYAEGLVKKAVSRGKMTPEKGEAILALITPTTDYELVKGSDLVIEAVFENREVKASVTKLAEAQLADTAIFGSNTSTLPITGLAKASRAPEELHRHPLLLAGRQDGPGRADHGRGDLARGPGQVDRLRPEDQEDPDRRQRQPRLLHVALLWHLRAGRPGDDGRGHRAGHHRQCRPRHRHAARPAGDE
jgi:hypothetical protein